MILTCNLPPRPGFKCLGLGMRFSIAASHGGGKMKSTLAVCLLASAVCVAAEKPRVYVTNSRSWEISGGVGGSSGGFAGAGKGGDRPQTAEIIKTFGERCPVVIINNKPENVDYVV